MIPRTILKHHKALAAEGFEVKVLPTWRPDRAMGIDKPGFRDYLISLGNAADEDIRDYASLVKAIEIRHQFFHDAGCRLCRTMALIPVMLLIIQRKRSPESLTRLLRENPSQL